jgi:hypothetical protein
MSAQKVSETMLSELKDLGPPPNRPGPGSNVSRDEWRTYVQPLGSTACFSQRTIHQSIIICDSQLMVRSLQRPVHIQEGGFG